MGGDSSDPLLKVQVDAIAAELTVAPGADATIARMDIYDIRRSNLELLRRKFEERCRRQKIRYTLKNFATAYGLDPSLCSQILNGFRKIGDESARKIDQHGNLGEGWMDILQTDVNPRDLEEKDAIERTLRLMRHSPEKLRKALLDAMDRLLRETPEE